MNKSKGYSGNISGLFDVDLFAMNLMTEPFAGRGNIDVDFDYSKPVILSSAGLKNFIVSNKKDTIEIGDILFNLNARDSLITSDFKSGFLNAEFNSRASFSDFKTALNIPPGSTDEKVACASGATAGYLGTDGTDGVLRAGTGIKMTAGGSNANTTLSFYFASEAQGDIAYRGADNWARLETGVAGAILQAGGAAANPSWITTIDGGTF
jgi:hypothetical protein